MFFLHIYNHCEFILYFIAVRKDLLEIKNGNFYTSYG